METNQQTRNENAVGYHSAQKRNNGLQGTLLKIFSGIFVWHSCGRRTIVYTVAWENIQTVLETYYINIVQNFESGLNLKQIWNYI